MIPIIVIFIVTVIILTLEVFHDDVHRLIRNRLRALIKKAGTLQDLIIDKVWSAKWHSINLGMWILSGGLVTFLMIWFTGQWMNLLIISMLICERILILNIGGNIKARGKGYSNWKLFYLGDNKWDKLFHGNEKMYHFVVLAVMIASIYFLIWNT